MDLIVSTVATHHGTCHLGQGGGHQSDGVVAIFASAANAVSAAHEVRTALHGQSSGGDEPGIGVRIGIDTGEAQAAPAGNYTSAALERGARLCDAANSGQVLLSSLTASIVADALPNGAWLADLALRPTSSPPLRSQRPRPSPARSPPPGPRPSCPRDGDHCPTRAAR